MILVPEIKIGNKIVSGTANNPNSLFKDFKETVSLTSFSNTFVMNIGDPNRRLLWDVIDCEEIVTSKISGVIDQFRINNMSVTFPPYNISLTGLSLESEATLDELEPVVYKSTTDNYILSKIFEGYTTDFDEAINIKKFEITAGETKQSAGQRLVNQNSFYLYSSNGIIYKKRIASSGDSVKTYSDKDILGSLTINKSTNNVRSELVLYSNDSDYNNIIETTNIDPTSVFTGDPINISRRSLMRAQSKDREEMKSTIEEMKYKLQPVESLGFVVKGRDKIELNQIVTIKFSNFKLNLQMVLNSKTFNVNSNGEVSTSLRFGGLGRNLK